MRKAIPLLLLLQAMSLLVTGQNFTVQDLVKLSALSAGNIDHFMSRKGYALTGGKMENDIMETEFTLKPGIKKNYVGPSRRIDIHFEKDRKTFTLYTSSQNELLTGQESLRTAGYFYDSTKNALRDFPMLFQKGNAAVQTSVDTLDGSVRYALTLTVRKLPDGVKYAEDLLQFDSHQLLVSFFGDQNVKKDLYYFSQHELQQCSVLFSGTPYQVVFVWGDGVNLDQLSYIIVPHILQTVSAVSDNPVTGHSEWQFRNGLYPGMDVKELLRLNQVDFDIYGKQSDLAYMVKPEDAGKIDFKTTAVTLSCTTCDELKIFNQPEVSAATLARNDIPMYVSDVILYPAKAPVAN